MLDRDWSLAWALVCYLSPVTLASAATVREFIGLGFRGTSPDWIRAALLPSRLVPLG